MALEICGPDGLRNFFSRAQHHLDKEFKAIEGINGVWSGKVRSGGNFPQGSGFAARTTLLGFERPRVGQIRWTPKVGLQDDCAVSCDTPAETVRLGNANHKWYRMYDYAENTEAFCLKAMWADALNLPAQIRNIVNNLKMRTMEIDDEFYRSNYAAIAANRWVGIDDGTNNPKIIRTLNSNPAWRFEEDANGTVNVNKIILNEGFGPEDIGMASVDTFNHIRAVGRRKGAFPLQGAVPLMTDFETMSMLPKVDTNVRMDNRYRDPEKLDPAYASISSYAGYDMSEDPFALRYYWDTEDPDYPDGVLTRIEHWQSEAVSEGCWDDVNEDYLNADFILNMFWNPDVYEYQTMSYGNPPGMDFSQPQSPYNGLWRFINEINEITPCNVDRTKAFWRAVFERAAKPDRYDLGHTLLTRRFNSPGVFRSCRALTVPVNTGTYYCDTTCAPLDHYPPALATRVVCGSWNEGGSACSSTI